MADVPGALVIGGDYRGLGVVRSLGRRGIPAWVLTDEHRVAAFSRYAGRSLRWPEGDEPTQVAFLLDLAARYRLDGWVLIPTGDETAALIARHHERLAARFRLTTPPWSILRWAYDKRLMHQRAEELGIDQPWTRYPADGEALDALECRFPLILKPCYKPELNRFTRAKAWRADDRATLRSRYAEARAFAPVDAIMVQELVPGGGEAQFSYGALCAGGRVRASVVARRERQHPLDFGRASSYVVTVERPEIETPARRLLEAVGLSGVVEIEFKRDARDGRYKLLDINPRVWGWHTLAQRAGVDLPYLLWRQALGLPVAEARARPGVRWARMATDLLAAADELRAGRITPGRYLCSLAGPLEYAIYAPDDPIPALADLPLLALLALRRLTAVRHAHHQPGSVGGPPH